MKKLTEIVVESLVDEAKTYDSKGLIRASSIGHPCIRKLQYDFHNPLPRLPIQGKAALRIAEGHRGERRFAALVRKSNSGWKITERQKEYKENTLICHIDGILTSPTGEKYIWEHKQVGSKNFAKAEKATSLFAWDETYFWQAVMAMKLSGVHQHYLTIGTGGAEYTEIITTLNDALLKTLKEKRQMIESPVILPPLSGWKVAMYCGSCQYRGRCFPQEHIN